MKTLILSSLIFSLLFLSASNSYSNPLNGTYTVGNGGNYPTINSAIDDAHLQGLSGPVIFEIIPGIYYDSIVISGKFINIYGDDFFSVTFRPRLSYSPANNYVMITGGISISGSTNIYIEDLSFDSDVNVEGKDIFYINNDFNGHSFTAHYYPINPNNEHNCNLIDNKNLMDVSFEHLYKITVNNNFISGKLKFFSCRVGTIENNVIDNGIFAESVWWYFTLSKNKINGNVVFLNLWTSWVFCSFYNNFITGSVIADEGRFINNTIINNSADTSTVFMESPPLYIANNIFINKAGGNVVNYRYWGGYTPFIDYNLYYNYSNDSLIQYSTSGLYNATFDNVPDFYNLSGFDEHSTSVPVSFVSPADLHLAASSYGDYGLIGIPNTLITDDIDGELRNSLYPYKGADEILDFPLPVELSLFSSSVNENDV
ncbi:MAG TPA: hypothetical protein PKA90_16925, partial [Ignavibacteria bacterium]|nr:hypothetical protein [Ignavibacteria bacterium]